MDLNLNVVTGPLRYPRGYSGVRGVKSEYINRTTSLDLEIMYEPLIVFIYLPTLVIAHTKETVTNAGVKQRSLHYAANNELPNMFTYGR